MRIFGFHIPFTKDVPSTLTPVYGSPRAWWPAEPFSGAWQRNLELRPETVLSFHAVFACVTLIASDIAKLRLKLMKQEKSGIWKETKNPAYSPVLRKPNHFQSRNQFWENWMLSKLTAGNTYVLKQRDERNVVVALYVLDPYRVKPLVAPDGSVFYQLRRDDLSGVDDAAESIPAKEIIHDRWNCLFHPLVGLSPLSAAGLAAMQGLKIQNNSTKFFGNGAVPGGVLTAPREINDATAERLKKHWQTNYSGDNVGKVAVLGDGLEFKPMIMTSVDAQMIEQLKLTAEMVCSTYHVPLYKCGLGPMPANSNVQALNLEYYSQALQVHIESAETLTDEGLSMAEGLGTEFDLDGLLRMDTQSQVSALKEAVGAAIMAPDEARFKLDLPPVPGGKFPLAQQQNYSLEALAKRDAKADPFATATPAKPAPETTPPADEVDDDETEEAKAFGVFSIALKEAA